MTAHRHEALRFRARFDRLARYGDREACLWREGVRWRSRSYARVHERALACAGLLWSSGLGRGDAVLIQGPSHPDYVEALLGTLRAGGVAIPLEESTPDDFRVAVARRVGARLLVAPPDVQPPPGCRRLDLGSWSAATPLPRGPLEIDVRPDERAEVVFTSGTTGEPKGVVLTHGNLAADFAPVERIYLGLRPLLLPLGVIRVISTIPLSHMFGQMVVAFVGPFMGFTMILAPPRPREVLEIARLKKATALVTVPRLLDLLGGEIRRALREEGRLEAIEARARRFERWPLVIQAPLFWRVQRLFGWRFRLFISGGAALPEEVQLFWQRLGYLVMQGYGLTETAPVISVSDPFERRLGSVGQALAGQEVRLGPDQEILVRGANVTPGYLRAESTKDSKAREEASAQRDAEAQRPADAKTQRDAGGWFHTGDVGEIDTRGRLRIRGRLMDMIVTPEGENVYPSDVEAAFGGLPGVREACVLGLPQAGGEQVHVVLLLDEGADPDEAVREANARLLPRQRVRDYTVWPESDFPRTQIGKVKKALVKERLLSEKIPAAGSEPASAGLGPVRRIVAQVGRVRPDRIKETTRLVEGLGFASLDLVELAVAFEEELGISLPEDRLADATVGDLERIVLAARGEAGGGGAAREGAAVEGAAPASAAAEGAASEGAAPESAPREGVVDLQALPSPKVRGSLRMPRWAWGGPARLLRRLVEEFLLRPFVLVYTRPEVVGLKHLVEAEPPFLLVANHRSYIDTVIFKVSLPRPLRGRIAPGMTTRYHRVFFGESKGGLLRYLREGMVVRLVELLSGAWPLPETAGFRMSVLFAGELADRGVSPLVFPEGRHVPEGTVEPFRKGIGILAREARLPVLPAYLEGTARVLPDGAAWLHFGKTRLILGRPFSIDPETDASEATRRIETAVLDLMPQASRRAGS